LFAEERQHLLEDAAEHRALFAGIRRERRRAAVVAEQQRRKVGDVRAGRRALRRTASRLG
jgi:hypothetical protein